MWQEYHGDVAQGTLIAKSFLNSHGSDTKYDYYVPPSHHRYMTTALRLCAVD